MPSWRSLGHLFMESPQSGDFFDGLKQFLFQSLQAATLQESEDANETFLGHLKPLLYAQEKAVHQFTLSWLLQQLVSNPALSIALKREFIVQIEPFKESWVILPILEALRDPAHSILPELYPWLSALAFQHDGERQALIEVLFERYVEMSTPEEALKLALKRLDSRCQEVTMLALQCFPQERKVTNLKLIVLLGYLGQYRAIRPLINFVDEYPDYLRPVMKAFSGIGTDEVNQFYLRCLDPVFKEEPVVLLEAIKQVRKRKIRKAIPLLKRLFPVNVHALDLFNQRINGEIALTLAEFLEADWAKESLLSEMLLSGTHAQYLKAIEILGLQEAVPLLKAIMLLPETSRIQVIQEQAYLVCEKLLNKAKQAGSL